MRFIALAFSDDQSDVKVVEIGSPEAQKLGLNLDINRLIWSVPPKEGFFRSSYHVGERRYFIGLEPYGVIGVYDLDKPKEVAFMINHISDEIKKAIKV